jgi:hypothetical protein
MILPSKHIKISESIIGLSGYLLKYLEKPKDLQAIWDEYSKDNNTSSFPAYHGFDHVVLALDFLYTIGAIDTTPSGEIIKCV